MLSERSLLLAGSGGYNAIDIPLCGTGAELTATPSTTAAAAAAFLYLEKVKNEKLSPRVTAAAVTAAAQIDSLKDASMESAANNNNNNCNSNSTSDNYGNNNNNIDNVISNNLVISHVQNALSGGVNVNNNRQQQHQHLQSQSLHLHAQQQQQQQQQNIVSNVKRERLSPGTNGEHQSTVSRSRTTTPSPFRGTPPQHMSTDTLVPLTSLLRIQQAASADRQNPALAATTADTTPMPTDFSSRNYSDFMRNLAAKYNNSNQNNTNTARRNPFFDTPSSTSTSAVANKVNQQSANKNAAVAAAALSNALAREKEPQPQLLSRLSMSPGEVAAAAAAAASFLSSLPFSQNVCPPLIDMSSTQALVTLARAAKEVEIQAILRPSQQQHPKRGNSSNSTSISPHPSLSVAFQQAAQFVSPALIYSAQLQQQAQASRQSSPMHTRSTAAASTVNSAASSSTNPLALSTSTSRDKSVASSSAAFTPLDLSSQPPAAKRYKAACSNMDSDTLNVAVRCASSTATNSPSPPISEKNVFIGCSPAITEVTKYHSDTSQKPAEARASISPTYAPLRSTAATRQCQAQSAEVNRWSVDDVCAFVGDIDICADYVQHFRNQCIDGSGLPLLTEEHLVNSLGMKLGPALKLRSALAKKLGGPCPCVACVTQAQQMLALQAAANSSAVGASTAPTAAVATAPEVGVHAGNINDSSDGGSRARQHERQEAQKNLQQLTAQRRTSSSNNNCNSNSNGSGGNSRLCSALALSICANMYKNEANNNNNSHNNEIRNSDNQCNSSKATDTANVANNSIEFKDSKCKSNNGAGNNSSSTNNNNSNKNHSSGQCVESVDAADVGS